MPEHTSETLAPSVVDLADLVHHDRTVRDATVGAIESAFATDGFVHLINHGVDFELRDRLYAQLLAFTERSTDEKQRYQRSEQWSQRGWTAGEEAGVCESFLAAPLPADAASKVEFPELSAPNLWPTEDETFEQSFSWLGQQLHEAGLSVLTGVAMAFGLTPRTFDIRVDGAPHLMRVTRSLGRPEGSIELSSLLTLSAGRRFFDERGKVMETEESEGSEESEKVAFEQPIVAHVGQQLEILSGGRMLAKAAIWDGALGLQITGAYELHLANHVLVTPLERFRSDEALRTYAPPVLAGTYRTKTLVDRGLAPASALDRLGYRPTEPKDHAPA